MRTNLEASVEPPVASLIDVVFLLIIFFIVTATVEKDVVDETIDLAQADHVPASESTFPGTVIVNVRRNGETSIGGYPVGRQKGNAGSLRRTRGQCLLDRRGDLACQYL